MKFYFLSEKGEGSIRRERKIIRNKGVASDKIEELHEDVENFIFQQASLQTKHKKRGGRPNPFI